MRYRFRAETESVTETKSRFMRRCTSWMRKRFRSGSSRWRCWDAEDGKRLLGHVCVQLIEKIPNPVNELELHAYLTNFYVVPEMRNQGLGKNLLNKALSWCRTRETDAVILWATLASRLLYRRCGLVEPTDILSCDVALIGRTEFDLVFVALHIAARSLTRALPRKSEFKRQR